MEIQYFGANCVRLSTKKASIVIDDNLSEVGLKSITKSDEIALYTRPESRESGAKHTIDQPGEYEVSDTSIQGISVKAHSEGEETPKSTIFKIIAEDIRVVALGHISPELDDNQLERIGTVDVMILPVGGGGYTLNPTEALKVIKKIGPKIIIPTHYNDKSIKYPEPQVDLAEAIKELAMEPTETVPKLKLKSTEIAEVTQLIVLERQ